MRLKACVIGKRLECFLPIVQYPCREGNRHISLLLDKVAEGTHTAQDIATLKKFADIMSSASLCGLGETAQSALLSCMKRFPEVFAVKEEVAVR